jgi:hypothetical protein
MRTKTLIALGAILAMAFAIGCSNYSRTTSPTNTVSDVPGLGFRMTGTVHEGTGTPPPTYEELRGLYFQEKTGCIYIQLAKDKFAELNFLISVPIQPKDGTPVSVKGTWSVLPSSHCGIGPAFDVVAMTVLISDRTDTPAPQEQTD